MSTTQEQVPKEELKQEVKQEEIEFSNICPTYAHWMENWSDLTHAQKVQIYDFVHSSATCCFMGESRGLNASWSLGHNGVCVDCMYFGSNNASTSLPACIKMDKIGRIRVDWKKWEERKNLLVEHWRNDHSSSSPKI